MNGKQVLMSFSREFGLQERKQHGDVTMLKVFGGSHQCDHGLFD